MGGSVKEIQSQEELRTVVSHGKPALLSTDFRDAHFFKVEAEEQGDISEAYAVSVVPSFVFFKDGQKFDAMEGANPSSLANKVAEVAGSVNPDSSAVPVSLGPAAGTNMLETVKEFAKQNGASQKETIATSVSHGPFIKWLKQLFDLHPILLFMKGDPAEPKCDLCGKVVNVLEEEGVSFKSYDILEYKGVGENLIKLYNWPTFPQLFCKGKLLGGCDVAVSMHESGQLKELFRDQGVNTTEAKGSEPVAISVSDSSTRLAVTLNSQIKNRIDSGSVVLFMEGKPEDPKCVCSREVVEILQEEELEFESFDILDDDEIRQGLEVHSNCSSFPQLYFEGELMVLKSTGKDIIGKETLEDIIGKKTLEDRLKSIISSSETMLFMKGTPEEPRCGFSSKVLKALKEDGLKFESFDVLNDEEVRRGLKTYSNWPTFPQLYYKGELIGGCDNVLNLHGSGELKSTLSD
ncbi:hypothetical protein MKX03_015827 [Papaver bracteatum]|nr:hypothetical protein MKX03_015827 [Papaver bracteatum]